MEATENIELGQRHSKSFRITKAHLEVEPLDDLLLHEKTQKLFKYARATGKQKELEDEVLDIKEKEQRRKLCQGRDERLNTALHYSAKAGNLDTSKFLVDQGAELNALGQNKMTPVQFAARYGDVNRGREVWTCMEWLVEETKRNGEIFVDARDDFSILHHAIQNTNWEEDPIVVWELIKTRRFNISAPDKQGNTSLHLAAQFDRQADHTLLEKFLPPYEEKDRLGLDYIDPEDLEKCIAAENKVGMTPLHVACAVGNPDSVKQLLAIGGRVAKSDLNSTDAYFATKN